LYPHHIVFALPARQIAAQVQEARSHFGHLSQYEITDSSDALFQMMHDILKTQAEHILEFIRILDFLIPERQIRHYKRPTREFCDGCDLVYKVSFGLAMDRDVQNLANSVARVQ
jgi:hypothetical protein